MEAKRLRFNVWKLYLIKAIRSFMLIIPVITLFFKENGLSMGQIFLLQSLFSVALILLEVPTGYFSDRFGRRNSITIGGVIASIGFVIYSQSHSFGGFLMAEITLGIGMSFISGSDSAMLYDTLAELGEQKRYQRVEGKGIGLCLLSEGTASIIGGFLALISLRFPLYCDTVITVLVIPLAVSLVEPRRQALQSRENIFISMFKLVKYSLHDQAGVKWIIIYSALVNASTLTMVWLIQPYLLATAVPVGVFGIVWASFLFTASMFSLNAYRIEILLGKKIAFGILIFLPVSGYFLLGSFWQAWSGIFILLFYVARGINNPIALAYINGAVSSDIRATVLSIKNLVGRLIFSLVGPIAGWTNDAFSLQTALLVSGSVFLVFGLVTLAFMHKNKAI